MCCALLFGGLGIWTDSANTAREQAAHSAELARLEEERIANSHLAMGEVKMPSISRTGDYRNVLKKLKDAGFTNVTAVGKGDLFFGILEDENDIVEITVDGAPEFEDETWYSMDVPIVISYHSFYTAKSASSSTTVVASTVSEDFCYGIQGEETNDCYWISPSEQLVKRFQYHKGGGLISMTGHIISGNISDGFTVRFNYKTSAYDGWDELIRLSDDALTVTFPDESEMVFSTEFEMDSVHRVFEGDTVIELPEGTDLSAFTSSETTSDTASSEVATSEQAATSKSTSSTLNYTDAYMLSTGDYRIYYLIDFENGQVRYFTYGNGNKYAQVGQITKGSKSEGITVHYKYDGGWDKTMTFSKSTMTLTSPDGYKTYYSKAPLKAVKGIYDNLKDMH